MAFKFILKNTETNKSKGFEFSGDGTYLVGRASDCAIRVGDKKTSSKHFKIVIKNNEVTVADMDSYNGIALDGFQVDKSRFYVGQIITFGVYTLVYDKKFLTPKELIANTRPSRDDGPNDVTMIATAKGLLIDREAIMDQTVGGGKPLKRVKGIAKKENIKKKIKKNHIK